MMPNRFEDLEDLEDVEELEAQAREQGRAGLFGDSIRKAFLTGMSAVLMTEEGIRGALGDMRLPKDALAYVAQQTERTRREMVRIVTDEIKSFLSGVDLTGEIRKALTGLRVEVSAQVRFVDDSSPPKAKVRSQVKRPRRTKKHARKARSAKGS